MKRSFGWGLLACGFVAGAAMAATGDHGAAVAGGSAMAALLCLVAAIAEWRPEGGGSE